MTPSSRRSGRLWRAAQLADGDAGPVGDQRTDTSDRVATVDCNEELRMNPQIKYVTLPTGVTVEYIESGALGGVPLLLLHGLSDSWHSFLPLLPHLPRQVRTPRLHPARPRPVEQAARRLQPRRRSLRTRKRSSTPCTSTARWSPVTRWARRSRHCSPPLARNRWQVWPCSARLLISRERRRHRALAGRPRSYRSDRSANSRGRFSSRPSPG